MVEVTENPAPTALVCPRHPDTRLRFILRGGVGHCGRCGLYVRALGVPEPEPLRIGKPKQAQKPRRKSARKAAKRTGKGKIQTPSPSSKSALSAVK
jgi:hypothetical protein